MKTEIKKQIVRSKKSQKGLTLIELLVVLVILVGIGGLALPTINSALDRTHVATCASNFAEVHQMIQRQLVLSASIGDGFQSGIQVDNTPVNDQNVGTLDANEVAALAGLGITTIYDHSNTFNDPTFDIGATAEPIAATTTNVVILTNDQADEIYLSTGNGERYAWFGIGQEWTGIGNVAPEAPVHFGDTPDFLPDQVYSRFGIVVQLGEDNDAATPVYTPFETAEYKRVSYTLGDTDGADGDAEFETADNHVGVYWNDIDDNN